MCGIAGVIGASKLPELRTIVGIMNHTQLRRGPDRQHVWVDSSECVGLGHTRLAIIDLAPTGNQPMLSKNGRWVITFNGEFYNFVEIRKILVRLGHEFSGHSDTEVLAQAIQEWGFEKALELMEGMFAVGAYDQFEKCCWLARDRAGEKPLYHANLGGQIVFASTLGAIESFPGFTSKLDQSGLASLLQHGYIRAPRTIYEKVEQLPSGHCAKISFGDGGPTRVLPKPFWNIPEAKERTQNPSKLSDLETILLEVVEEQSVADRPVGAFLSGGIDSTLITCLMREVSSAEVTTFTIGFNENRYNEANHARSIAAALGTNHHEKYFDPDICLDYVNLLPEIYGEPFADLSQLPTILLSKEAKRLVTVALTGDGGDETFAGYSRYFQSMKLWNHVSRLGAPGRKGLATLFRMLDREFLDNGLPALLAQLRIRNANRSLSRAFRYWSKALSHHDLNSFYDFMIRRWHDPREIMKLDFKDLDRSGSDTDDTIVGLMRYDFQNYLPDDVLVKVDRASMFSSLETRAPLLDRRVVETAWRLPVSELYNNKHSKIALRKLLAERIPIELVDRPKQGFGVPMGGWLRGPLKVWSESLLLEQREFLEFYFDWDRVKNTWDNHQAGTWDNSQKLWPVLVFASWAKGREGIIETTR